MRASVTSWTLREIHNFLTFVRRVSEVFPLEPHRGPRLLAKPSNLNPSVCSWRPSAARDVLIALGRFDTLIGLNDAQVTRHPQGHSEAREQLVPGSDPNPVNSHSSVSSRRKPPTNSHVIATQIGPERSRNSLALVCDEGSTPGTTQPTDITTNQRFKRKRSLSPGQFTHPSCFRFFSHYVRQPPIRAPGTRVRTQTASRHLDPTW